jgi:hypothetical protein
VGEKPKGANFYPADMSKEEFEAFPDKMKNSQYTVIRRDGTGKLRACGIMMNTRRRPKRLHLC